MASVYGGAGGRGAKVSVSSPEGLRNFLRAAPEPPSSAPVTQAKPSPASPAPSIPENHQQSLRNLNGRLSKFLDKVKQLEEENAALDTEIRDILAQRKSPKGRDWDKVLQSLNDLEQKIKLLTLDNAKHLLKIDNAKLANQEFKNLLDDETKVKKVMKKDLDKVKNIMKETKPEKDNLQKEIELVNTEINALKQDHNKLVVKLLKDIKDSKVKVEIDSSTSNLADVINKIRAHYQKLSEKNLKETEDWYNNKFENIEEEETQNNEILESENLELKQLLKDKKTLEVQIKTKYTTIETLEKTKINTTVECNQRMIPINRMITKMEANLTEVRAQLERQVDTNRELLTIKMKLEKEIDNYRKLIWAENESSQFALEEALQSAPRKPELRREGEEEEEQVKQERAVEEVVVCSGNLGSEAAPDGSRRKKK